MLPRGHIYRVTEAFAKRVVNKIGRTKFKFTKKD